MKFILLALLFLPLAHARFFEFIPCGVHLSTSSFPAYENERSKVLTNLWLEAMEKWSKNPTQDARQLAREFMVPSERPTIEWLDQNLTSLVRDEKEFSDLTKFSYEGIENGEVFFNRFKEEHLARLKDLHELVKKVLAKPSPSYEDLIVTAQRFAPYIDAELKWKSAITQFKVYQKNGMSMDQFFPMFWTQQLAQVEPTIEVHLSHFPFIVRLPSPGPLGFRSMNRLHGVPVHYLGLTAAPLQADGYEMRPGYFMFHDQSHSDTTMIMIDKEYFNIPKETFFKTMQERRAFFTPEKADFFVKKMIETNQVYGAFNEALKSEEFTKRERTLLEAVFFFMTHEYENPEYGVPLTTKENLILNLKRIVKDFETNQKTSFFHNFHRRINDQKDLGQAFRPPDSPREISEVVSAVKKVLQKLN